MYHVCCWRKGATRQKIEKMLAVSTRNKDNVYAADSLKYTGFNWGATKQELVGII